MRLADHGTLYLFHAPARQPAQLDIWLVEHDEDHPGMSGRAGAFQGRHNPIDRRQDHMAAIAAQRVEQFMRRGLYRSRNAGHL